MEQQPNKYSGGKIYKLESDEDDRIYIGSTTSSLRSRMSGHKSDYRRYNDGRRQTRVSSFEILAKRGCRIVLVEAYPCESVEELLQRERHHIEANRERAVNATIPWRTPDELREANARAVMRRYYDNRGAILASRAELVLCDCGKTVTKHHLKEHRSRQIHAGIVQVADGQ